MSALNCVPPCVISYYISDALPCVGHESYMSDALPCVPCATPCIQHTRAAMSCVGLSAEQQDQALQLVAALLHLSNVTFTQVGNSMWWQCVLAAGSGMQGSSRQWFCKAVAGSGVQSSSREWYARQ